MYDEDTLLYLRHELQSAVIQGDMEAAAVWLKKVDLVQAELVLQGVDLMPVYRKDWGLDD